MALLNQNNPLRQVFLTFLLRKVLNTWRKTMFPYKDIPHEIKESVDINSLRRIAPKWDNQKILSKYLESYIMGMGMITEHRQKDPDYIPTRIQYLLSVLVIKKETFIMTTVTA